MPKDRELKKSHIRKRRAANESCMVTLYPELNNIEMHYLEILVLDSKGKEVGTIILRDALTIPLSKFDFTPKN